MSDRLNDVMGFGCVVEVDSGGNVTESDVCAPELYDGHVSPGWTLLDGWSGQYGYSGPIMHASEYIGGAMEDHILSEPGVYVALVDYPTDSSGSAEPEGWAVARKDTPL